MLTKRRRNQCYMCCNANTLLSWSFVGNQIEDSMVNGKLSGFAMNFFSWSYLVRSQLHS